MGFEIVKVAPVNTQIREEAGNGPGTRRYFIANDVHGNDNSLDPDTEKQLRNSLSDVPSYAEMQNLTGRVENLDGENGRVTKLEARVKELEVLAEKVKKALETILKP